MEMNDVYCPCSRRDGDTNPHFIIMFQLLEGSIPDKGMLLFFILRTRFKKKIVNRWVTVFAF